MHSTHSHSTFAVRQCLLLLVLCSPLISAPPPELTVLRTQYDKVVAERVTAPFEASLNALNAKFTTALGNAAAVAKKSGNLPEVLAIQADIKALADKQSIPPDHDQTPEPLKKLRAIYREQVMKLEELRVANTAALLTPYAAKLQELESSLTKADRIDEAAAVLAYRQSLTTAAPAAPTTGPATNPEPLKGGVLRGLGQFMFGNLPVDLSNAEGISDFVEIKVSHMGWIARRAGGEVRFQIQSYGDKTKGIANTKKAVRVCATEGKLFFAIYEDGTAEVLGTKFEGSDALPLDANDIVDVDTASGLLLILHRDGSCSFHGKRQQDMTEGLELKPPGVLREVAAISCARYHAYFLMKDGSVMATTEFRDKRPAWAKLPRNFSRDIFAIAAGAVANQFVAITNKGYPIQPNGDKLAKSLNDLAAVKMGGDAAIAKDRVGRWQIAKPGDPDMTEFLKTAISTPQIIDIDIHNHDNSGDGKLTSRSVLWIEAIR